MADNIVNISDQKQDEYLTLLQTAFLIGQSEQNTMSIVKSGKMQSVKRNNRMFIPVDSLKSYIYTILGKYQEAILFLDLPDDEKKEYLIKILPSAYHGRSPDPARYLTVVQVSYLSGCSRQTVYDLIRKGVFRKIRRSGSTLIPIEDFAAFILGKMNLIRPALLFFEEDSFSFWTKEEQRWNEFYQRCREERGCRCRNSVKG